MYPKNLESCEFKFQLYNFDVWYDWLYNELGSIILRLISLDIHLNLNKQCIWVFPQTPVIFRTHSLKQKWVYYKKIVRSFWWYIWPKLWHLSRKKISFSWYQEWFSITIIVIKNGSNDLTMISKTIKIFNVKIKRLRFKM